MKLTSMDLIICGVDHLESFLYSNSQFKIMWTQVPIIHLQHVPWKQENLPPHLII